MILTVNAGSSSVRLTAFEPAGERVTRLEEARYERGTGPPGPTLATFLRQGGLPAPDVVGHRIVHGGESFTEPCRITAEVEAALKGLTPLAPLHNPLALEWVRACREAFGDEVPQVAVFDTTFFIHLPPAARFYALPPALCRRHGIRRYGFHGLAHQAMWERWVQLRPDLDAGGRLITVQLGSGCSMAAIKRGRPMDTSMGFSPTEGLVMATRTGDLDPSVILYLQREAGMSVDELERLLNEDSGLRGVSQLSSDVRRLLAADTPPAHHALGLYCLRARKYLGAYMALLGGVDGIVFGGGVGEHQPVIRERILDGLAWCGVELDPVRNTHAQEGEHRISAENGAVDVRVLPVDEARILAGEAVRLAGAN